ncbi:fasciclin domain-containing protein [Halotia wernerae UHCC 0503]|nr:fasciclin domain-containing protein [Halotia wernerae UHCC 0503]
MKANYSKLLSNLASVVGVTGVSLLITLPSQAKEATNPHPSIFNEAPYTQIQVESVSELTKESTKSKKQVAQGRGNSPLNPRPSIFDEPPYNRGSQTTPSETVPTTPEATPTTPPTEVPTTETPDTKDKNLVAIAESNGSFTMLTQALKAAGLTDTLQGKEDFTVFAPTDAAFAKLPQDAVRDLLKPENKEVLVKLLTYHVVRGKMLSTDLKSGEVKSIEGGAINVKVDSTNGVTVNDAKVVKADITGSNGVIHAIDQVILPPDL